MAASVAGRSLPVGFVSLLSRSFRSDAALEALAKASEAKTPNIILYNYPSFSGAFAALFAHLYHDRLNLPHLVLPFSSVEPFRVEDLCVEGVEKCYFLDFIGPKGLALELRRRTSCEVLAFDHRKSVVSSVPSMEECDESLRFQVNLEKSSSRAAYEYFSSKLSLIGSTDASEKGDTMCLLNSEVQDQMDMVLKYIEDGDLRKWSLPDIRAFNLGLSEWRPRLNCITNPLMYEQLMEMKVGDLIAKGKSYISSRQNAANKLLDKVVKLQLGRGLYGSCLGVRADGNSDLSDEIGKELSRKSAAAGLRPIGAVIYMQRNNLKMCLRSTDSTTDTSEVAKAYGGGGSPSSSSFIIRMDEYNEWLAVNRR
ncbi:PREDICTED: uncharacterized protein LOC109161432 [Ipomoea nil]|uniref:uncharacterized protein LOC109161432 n=1 Tax=Ipomoea nil TaxID=35883 RepID=UPI000901BD01|nr:PREDICTED: uncharacterized protein LOC109161432 [Ipomoea nil]